MNIFYLDYDPVKAAQAHLDKHVVKMILEYAQLLCTAHRIIDGREKVVLSASGRKKKVYELQDENMDAKLYSATHVNHPSAIWARQHIVNYKYLYSLFVATCNEYTHRYGKVHLTDTKLRDVLANPPTHLYVDHQTRIWLGPTPAMPDECKIKGDHLASYRKYYIDKKADMAKWTNREPPEWFIEGIKEKDAYVRLQMQEVRELFRKSSKDVGARRRNAATVSRV
jgi:hypothetical protein